MSGYYGFGNVGDEALLEGLLGGLIRAGHEPVVLSNDPKETVELHGVAARHRFYGVPAALIECQALISGGGGLLQDKTSLRSLRYYLSIVRYAKALGKRVVVYGQSIGPLSPAGKQLLAAALAGVPIAVRDEQSQELLAGLRIPSELVADPALLLQAPEPSGEGRGPVLLVPRAGHPELTQALASLATHLYSHDCAVEVLTFHPREDTEEYRRLSRSVPELLLRQARDHREVLRLISSASVVVSARLHGLILATVAHTPSVGLVYDPKVTGYLTACEGVGFEPPVDPSLLLAAVEGCRAVDEAVRQRLLERAAAGVSWLDRTLRGQTATIGG
ncbi:MAG: polysaccharide pyruvyl transferase CsaB [Trueperaceae bacterium]